VKFGSNQIPFQKLWQELRAINLWDKNYEASESHDFIERASCAARRRRMREIVLELISLNSRSQPEPRRWACPRTITVSETASEAAKLLSKLQPPRKRVRAVDNTERFPSDRINNSRFFENPSPAAIWVYMQAISAFEQQCRNPLDCEPAWVAMAEFNLNLGWWNSLATGKNIGNFAPYSASNDPHDRCNCWKRLSLPRFRTQS